MLPFQYILAVSLFASQSFFSSFSATRVLRLRRRLNVTPLFQGNFEAQP